MDLSHSGMFDKVKDNFQAGNRGGYKQWFNPVYADPNKNTRMRPTKTSAIVFGDEDDDDAEEDDDLAPESSKGRGSTTSKANEPADEPANDEPANDETPIDTALEPERDAAQASSRAPSRAPSVAPQSGGELVKKRIRNTGEVQILEFHSDNPIISYKGRIFSGSWASNIGTELIFGAHDEIAERDLPYLQSLPGGVDLMAASSCRILTQPADLRHKYSLEGSNADQGRALDKYRKLRKQTGVQITINFDKHGRRKPQARFLENLMAIKRQRGEFDEPTTMTKDTMLQFVDKDLDPEEASAQKKRDRDRRRQKKLQNERDARPKKRRRGGNRWVTTPTVTFADDRQDGGEGARNFSVMTPGKWAELKDDGDSDSGSVAGDEPPAPQGANGEDTVMQNV